METVGEVDDTETVGVDGEIPDGNESHVML